MTDVGRTAHTRHKKWLVKDGWADHPFSGTRPPRGRLLWECRTCRERTGNGRDIEVERHNHEDMVALESLPEERRAYFRAIEEAVLESHIDLLEAAWGIIANANNGDCR